MTIAGIVTYHPEIDRLAKNINAILPQVDQLIIVDNHSKNINEIENLLNEKIKIIKNNQNKGIAFALNQICQYAISNQNEWVLLLDQDSIVSNDLIEVFSKYSNDSISIIAPKIIYDENNRTLLLDNSVLEVNDCITSGSYINLNHYQTTGGFNNELFIDYVDFDYCARVRKIAKIIKINKVYLLHKLGEMEVKSILFKKINVTHHSPIRIYYKVRNMLYLSKTYPKDFNKLSIKMKILKLKFKVLCFEKHKVEKFRAIKKGKKDYKQMSGTL